MVQLSIWFETIGAAQCFRAWHGARTARDMFSKLTQGFGNLNLDGLQDDTDAPGQQHAEGVSAPREERAPAAGPPTKAPASQKPGAVEVAGTTVAGAKALLGGMKKR